MAKTPISKKLAKRDYKPAPRLIAWIYKTIMVDIIGRKYKIRCQNRKPGVKNPVFLCIFKRKVECLK